MHLVYTQRMGITIALVIEASAILVILLLKY